MRDGRKKNGFVLLIAVLGLLVFSTTLLLALAQFSLGNMVIVETARTSRQTLALAEGCAEKVLNELRGDAFFSEGAVVLPTGECTLVIDQDGSSYDIHIEARDGLVVKRVLIECVRGDTTLAVTAWLEE